MKELLKRELNRTYLILSSEDTAYEESYELQMITSNEPQGILPLQVFRMDGHVELFYEVSSKQTLKDCVERTKLCADTIRKLFQSVDRLTKEVREYLLDVECVVLDLEHIYTREGEFYFCYCPWERRNVLSSFQRILEEILGNLDYHDTKGVELAYHLYQSACRGDLCIAEILEEHSGEEQVEEETFPELFSEMEIPAEEVFVEEKQETQEKKIGIIGKILRFFLKKEKQEKDKIQIEDSFGEPKEAAFYEEDWTDDYERGYSEAKGSTILLGNMPAGSWKLRPLLPGQTEFCITGESFLVGKKHSCVDGYINRDTISRIHSRMFVRNGSLYIADANSTNGTFVNGKLIEPGKEMEIFPGDRILFADVEYECYNSL